MNDIYIALLSLAFYKFFPRIVDVFIGKKDSMKALRIKTKVFFHTFVTPVMFFGLIFLIVTTENKTFNILFACFLIIGILIRMSLIDRTYLTKFQIDEENLKIQYLTPYLKTKTILFSLLDISNLEMARANRLIDYPAEVNVRYKEQWITFLIIDKTFEIQTRRDINAANK